MEIAEMNFSGMANLYQFIGFLLVYVWNEFRKSRKERKLEQEKTHDRHDKHEEILRAVKENGKQTKRLEYLNAVQHFPTRQEWIMRLYGEYKALGGNSYIDKVHTKWVRQYGMEQERPETDNL